MDMSVYMNTRANPVKCIQQVSAPNMLPSHAVSETQGRTMSNQHVSISRDTIPDGLERRAPGQIERPIVELGLPG